MKEVGKYNLFKTLSLLVTCIPTFLVGLSFSDEVVEDAGKSMSFAGVIGILIALLFLKDKLAENFKLPSPFIISAILFGIIVLIEQILMPVKFTCLTVMIVTGVDELIFKRIYKRIELLLPETGKIYKHFGFYMCKTEKLIGESDNEQN